MIYTAIFQTGQGALTFDRYLGVVSKKESWLSAAKQGAKNNKCLLALVPGDHPVYFYENFVADNDTKNHSTQQDIKAHDVFDINITPDEEAYEMT